MTKLDCCEINKNRMKLLNISNWVYAYVCRSIFIKCYQFNVKQ